MIQSTQFVIDVFCAVPTLLAMGLALAISGARGARRALGSPPSATGRSWEPVVRSIALTGAGVALLLATVIALAFLFACNDSSVSASRMCSAGVAMAGSSAATLCAFIGLAFGAVVVVLDIRRGGSSP